MILVALSLMAAQPALDCEQPQTQLAMTMCASREYEAADRDMNRVWGDVRDYMKHADATLESSDDQPGYWDSLLTAQRAWLAYRDAHCLLSSYDARGGSLQPMLRGQCLTSLTRERTHQLHNLLINQVSGEAKTGRGE